MLDSDPQQQLAASVDTALGRGGQVTILTGAGVSAESGIPTFRGPEGYWQVGSRNYQPQEIATQQMFQSDPVEVWKWFLFRRGVCRAASPNPGHEAIARMEQRLGDRFCLITQNVDGLHLRAGNSLKRTLEVHGNLHFMRCTRECSRSVDAIPEAMPPKQRGEDLTPEEWALLVCPRCGARTRPHVLLWDEFYNERFYRSRTALQSSQNTDLLIVVGTTGAANLPHQIVAIALQAGATLINIDPTPNAFSDLARSSPGGLFLQAPSAEVLPAIAEIVQRFSIA